MEGRSALMRTISGPEKEWFLGTGRIHRIHIVFEDDRECGVAVWKASVISTV